MFMNTCSLLSQRNWHLDRREHPGRPAPAQSSPADRRRHTAGCHHLWRTRSQVADLLPHGLERAPPGLQCRNICCHDLRVGDSLCLRRGNLGHAAFESGPDL